MMSSFANLQMQIEQQEAQFINPVPAEIVMANYWGQWLPVSWHALSPLPLSLSPSSPAPFPRNRWLAEENILSLYSLLGWSSLFFCRAFFISPPFLPSFFSSSLLLSQILPVCSNSATVLALSLFFLFLITSNNHSHHHHRHHLSLSLTYISLTHRHLTRSPLLPRCEDNKLNILQEFSILPN